jgi:hypothetical protein
MKRLRKRSQRMLTHESLLGHSSRYATFCNLTMLECHLRAEHIRFLVPFKMGQVTISSVLRGLHGSRTRRVSKPRAFVGEKVLRGCFSVFSFNFLCSSNIEVVVDVFRGIFLKKTYLEKKDKNARIQFFSSVWIHHKNGNVADYYHRGKVAF